MNRAQEPASTLGTKVTTADPSEASNVSQRGTGEPRRPLTASQLALACTVCGMRLAAYAGPGRESGWTCVRCDEVAP